MTTKFEIPTFDALTANFVKFGNDNVAAVKASAEVVAAGVTPLVELATANAKGRFEALKATLESYKGVTSPIELFKLQADAGKAALEAAKADAEAFGQAVVALTQDAIAPIKTRFEAVAKLAA